MQIEYKRRPEKRNQKVKGMKEVLEYPTEYRLSSGTGTSPHELVAFDNALLSAGISNYNLLKVSSILPK